MNTTAGPSIKNKRKNISNSLSGGKKPRSITRKTLTGLQKKNLCEMFNTRLYQNQELAEYLIDNQIFPPIAAICADAAVYHLILDKIKPL